MTNSEACGSKKADREAEIERRCFVRHIKMLASGVGVLCCLFGGTMTYFQSTTKDAIAGLHQDVKPTLNSLDERMSKSEQDRASMRTDIKYIRENLSDIRNLMEHHIIGASDRSGADVAVKPDTKGP
jgi:hypothetical protein